MLNQAVITAVQALFSGTDERDWEKVKSILSDKVLLDYTSMSGGTPAELAPDQIVGSWASFLPGFDRTYHQLSGFEVVENNEIAEAHYSGKAEHYIGTEIWIVEATYDTELINKNGKWLISKQKLNFIQQSGNTELSKLAGERMKK